MCTYGFSIVRVMLITYVFFFQAEDGIRDLVRSRGLGDVYKRQADKSEVMDGTNKRAFTFLRLHLSAT